MKLTGVGQTNGPKKTDRSQKAGKAAPTGKSSFSSHLDSILGGAGEVHSADSPQPVTGVESLLAAQNVDDSMGEEARRRMARRGEEILDRLEEVRLGLLNGSIPKSRLAELAQLVRHKRESGADPRLSAIMDEIELRAEVELTKLTRYL